MVFYNHVLYKNHTKVLPHLPKNYQIQAFLRFITFQRVSKTKTQTNGEKKKSIFYAQKGASRERLTTHNYVTFTTLPLN